MKEDRKKRERERDGAEDPRRLQLVSLGMNRGMKQASGLLCYNDRSNGSNGSGSKDASGSPSTVRN